MEKETYADSTVAKYINRHFIAVSVDQDERPDLSNKYEKYGWPATIIFDKNGQELVKETGYIRKEKMLALLRSIVENSSQKEKADPKNNNRDEGKDGSINSSTTDSLAAKQVTLSAPLRKELKEKYFQGFDSKYGAWGRYHKFLDADSIEYTLVLYNDSKQKDGKRNTNELEDGAKQSNNNAEQMLRLSLDGGLNLIDPVWGGVYQYSTDGDWEHPHFEKIMSVQADNMRMYAQAYAVLKDQRYLAAAEKVANYVGEFLTSPQGAFYTSQDADLVSGEHSQDYFALDDAKRRARGLPKIDRHVYARENGWMIYSLCYLYAASGNESYLAQAQRAANWIWDNRQISGGGFSHDAKDNSGPYLGDNLYMARAFLALYEVTGSRSWLEKAESTAKFIAANFCMEDKSGFATIEPAKSGKLEPAFMLDENVALCRFANKLYYYSGEAQYKAMAENALSFLTQADIARSRKILIAGILLCDQEMSMEPLHVTVVGAKADAQAKALFCAANALPETYKRIEWYDRTEGSLPNSSVEFPSMPKAAAFMCANGQCSMPAYTADDLNKISKLF